MRKRVLERSPDGVDGENGQPQDKRYRRSPVMSPRTFKVLQDWASGHSHMEYPFPSDAEKLSLARETGLDVQQIDMWFKNNRERIGAANYAIQNGARGLSPNVRTVPSLTGIGLMQSKSLTCMLVLYPIASHAFSSAADSTLPSASLWRAPIDPFQCESHVPSTSDWRRSFFDPRQWELAVPSTASRATRTRGQLPIGRSIRCSSQRRIPFAASLRQRRRSSTYAVAVHQHRPVPASATAAAAVTICSRDCPRHHRWIGRQCAAFDLEPESVPSTPSGHHRWRTDHGPTSRRPIAHVRHGLIY